MRRNIVFVLLVVGFSSCSLLNPEPPATPSPDYWPLAVGNTWEYSYSYQGEQRTPNGINNLSRSATVYEKIISSQKTNDTTELFVLERIINNDKATFEIRRTTNTVGYSYTSSGFTRTGMDSILTLSRGISTGGGFTNSITKYKKGVGMIEEIEKSFSHITAGNEISGTSTTKLVKYSLK